MEKGLYREGNIIKGVPPGYKLTPGGKVVSVRPNPYPKSDKCSTSKGFPKWRCKRACEDSGEGFDPDIESKRCPLCRGPLIRWLRYEEKS
jgi:hypothetical protein